MTDDRAINFRKQYSGDYKSIELRVLAHITDDPQLYELYSHIQDSYVYVPTNDVSIGLTRDEIKRQAFSAVYNFNPYREVDEDSDYTDADAQLDNDYRDYIDDEVE